MSSSSNTTILITGANRGIGKGLLEAYLAKSHTTVIAANRDPRHPTSQALSSLPTGPSSQLIVLKLDSSFPTDAAAVIHALQTKHDVSHLDIVVANAGISNLTAVGPVADQSLAEVQKHFTVNALGPLALFQAVLPLLKKATQPKFVIIGSSLGCTGSMEASAAYPFFAYGASKAVAHYMARKIYFENEGLVAFAVSPGWVQTDMGNDGAKLLGMEKAATTIEDSVEYLVKTIDGATRENKSGKFPSLEAGEAAW